MTDDATSAEPLPQDDSEVRELPPRRSCTGVVLRVVGLSLGVLVVFVVLSWTVPALGSPSGVAIAHSLARQVGGYDARSCAPIRQAIWTCDVWDDSQSGAVTYRLVLDGDCWTARRVPPPPLDTAPEREARADGCVRISDQLRLVDRIDPLRPPRLPRRTN